VSLNDRINAFRERHPEVRINPPTGQDAWEVREPGRPRTLHPWAATMMDDLEARYDNPAQATQPQEDGSA
jgi:hypothetical protein